MGRNSCKIFILGNYRQTIAVILSLAKSGYDIMEGHSGEKEFTEFSRHVTGTWTHPEIAGNEEEFINYYLLNPQKVILTMGSMCYALTTVFLFLQPLVALRVSTTT